MYFVTFWVPNIVVICINIKPLLMGYVYNVCTKLLKWGCVLPLGPPTSPHSLKMFGSSYIWLGAAVSGGGICYLVRMRLNSPWILSNDCL